MSSWDPAPSWPRVLADLALEWGRCVRELAAVEEGAIRAKGETHPSQYPSAAVADQVMSFNSVDFRAEAVALRAKRDILDQKISMVVLFIEHDLPYLEDLNPLSTLP